MATRTFHTNSSDGVVMITKSGKSDGQLSDISGDPYGNLEDIYFHTGLDYVQGTGKLTKASISFPAVVREVVTWDDSSGCFGC